MYACDELKILYQNIKKRLSLTLPIEAQLLLQVILRNLSTQF